jgi:spore coat protein U-like protein
MKKFIFSFLLLIIVFIFLCINSVFAACNVSTTSVNFDNYDVFSINPLDATGTITVSCDERQPPTVTIAIGPSLNSGGFDPRMMKHTARSDLLSYNLYIDRNYTRIWGDGSGNTYTRSRKVGRRRPWVSTVYGRIPPGQDVSVGTYNETLTVIITW